MALSLASISRRGQVRAPRILLLGPEKIGKTSFACGCKFEAGERVAEGANSPIVLPMRGEEGADDMHVGSFPTLSTYDEVLEAIGVLYAEKHDYRTVVLDSWSALEPIIWDHVCRKANVDSIEKVGGGYSKGYTEAAGAAREILAGLDALRNDRNMSCVMIGHVKVKRFDDPGGDSYDQYQFDVDQKLAKLLGRWADVTLFANTKVAIKKEDVGFGKTKARGLDVTGGARYLFTQPRPAHPGGGRGVYGGLPYELPLDWTAFEEAVGAALDRKNNISSTMED